MATLSLLPADEEAYAFEVKWDGMRAIAFSEPGRLRLETRTLRDVTAGFPELNRLQRQLGARRAVLDGEIVAFDGAGRPSFQQLQGRMHLANRSQVTRAAKSRAGHLHDLRPPLPGRGIAAGSRLPDAAPAPGGARPGGARVEGAADPRRHRRRRARSQPQGWPGGDHRQAGRLGLRARAPGPGMAEDQERPAPGVRHRRFHRGHRPAQGLAGRTARRLPRGRRAALRRQGRHRLFGRRPGDAGKGCFARASASARRSPTAGYPRRRPSSGPIWSANARSPSGRHRDSSASRASSACARTSRPPTSSARRCRGDAPGRVGEGRRTAPRRAGGRRGGRPRAGSLQPGQGALSQGRVHQGRRDRLLPAGGAGHAGAPGRPAGHPQALPERRRQGVLLRKERAPAPARLGARR